MSALEQAHKYGELPQSAQSQHLMPPMPDFYRNQPELAAGYGLSGGPNSNMNTPNLWEQRAPQINYGSAMAGQYRPNFTGHHPEMLNYQNPQVLNYMNSPALGRPNLVQDYNFGHQPDADNHNRELLETLEDYHLGGETNHGHH